MEPNECLLDNRNRDMNTTNPIDTILTSSHNHNSFP